MKLLVVLLIAFSTRAEVINLSFPKDLKQYRFENVFESKKLKHPLALWRRSEIDKKYKDCIIKGPSYITKNKVIAGWIFSVWSTCVYKASQDKFDEKVVLTFLDNIRIHNQKNLNGPWRNSILNQTQKIILLSISIIEKEPKKNIKLKNKLLSVLELDDAYQNSEIYLWFQAQLDSKLPSFNIASKSKRIWEANEVVEAPSKNKLMTLEEYMNAAVSNAVLGTAQFTQIAQIEPILDSIKWTYRKMDYKKIADLAPRLETLYKNSELYRDYAMILGRTFHFLGEYSKSLEYFQIVLDFYADSADYEEALFRSGLVSLRKNDPKTAQKYLQRLVQLDRDKYDITGRYWWLRCLQYNKDPKELDEKYKFVSDFPFSFYGLRIKAELNNGRIKPPSGLDVPSIKWTLTGRTAEVWERFIKLSELGWVLEAQQEMQTFSWPQNPLKVFYLSKVLSKANLYPLSVKTVTPLLESYSEVRSLDAIKDIYPKSYLNLILKEKNKYLLHENLILSLIRQESSFGLKALSTSNAAGLMQMIQPTAMEVADNLRMKIEFPDDLYRPEINVPMGVFYIHQVIKEMNFNVPLGLAGYNAGPHKIRVFLNQRDVTRKIFETAQEKDYPGLEDVWIDELPWAETTGYVKSILRNILIYELIDKGEYQYRPDFWRDFILK